MEKIAAKFFFMMTLLSVLVWIILAGCKSSGPGGDLFIPESGPEDFTATEYVEEFKAWEEFERPFSDADKTVMNNMCWAAAAANIITWCGWAADEDDTFNIFENHFRNEYGYVFDALRYYFKEYTAGTLTETVAVRETRSHRIFDFMVSALGDGQGLAVKVSYPNRKVGHFLTVYGYRYFEDTDDFGLFYTDSDDGAHRMKYVRLTWNDEKNRWESPGWYLEYAISLERNFNKKKP